MRYTGTQHIGSRHLLCLDSVQPDLPFVSRSHKVLSLLLYSAILLGAQESIGWALNVAAEQCRGPGCLVLRDVLAQCDSTTVAQLPFGFGEVCELLL